MKKNINIKSFLIALGFGICAFVILLFLASMLKNEETFSDVVWAIKEIPKGTIITENNINNYTSIISINDMAKNNNNILDKKELINKEAAQDIAVSSPEPLSLNMFIDKDNEAKKYDNPVIIAVTVDDFCNAANGIIRKGDYVNIYKILTSSNSNVNQYNENENNLIIENTKILEAFDGSGNIIPTDDKTSLAVSFNIYIEEEQQQQIANSIANKNLSISLK